MLFAEVLNCRFSSVKKGNIFRTISTVSTVSYQKSWGKFLKMDFSITVAQTRFIFEALCKQFHMILKKILCMIKIFTEEHNYLFIQNWVVFFVLQIRSLLKCYTFTFPSYISRVSQSDSEGSIGKEIRDYSVFSKNFYNVRKLQHAWMV